MESLANNLLIAMPTMDDPQFRQAVVYLCEHNEQGAMGLVINRSLNLQLSAILKHINIECDRDTVNQHPVLWGGPANSDQMFTLHPLTGRWESTLELHDHLGMTTSKDLLESLASGQGPDKLLVTLGFAGWEAGQLETEIAANLWLTAPVTPEHQSILFDLDLPKRWHAAAAILGVDFTYLAGDAGHA